MTGIERVGWPITARTASRKPGASGFSVPLQTANTGATTAAVDASAPALATMLSLQELGSETVRDREAKRRGQDLLAALADLQRLILSAESDGAALRRLADLVAAVPLGTDRRLNAIVSAIVVRARVELARRQL
jgi:Class II flagellar assembly regulator